MGSRWCGHAGCDAPADTRGLCWRHYKALFKAAHRLAAGKPFRGQPGRPRKDPMPATPRARKPRPPKRPRTDWATTPSQLDALGALLDADEVTGWQQGAPCTQPRARGVDFQPATADATQTLVTRFCGACPVRLDCVAFALRHREEWGCWGGTQLADRKRIARALQAHRTTAARRQGAA